VIKQTPLDGQQITTQCSQQSATLWNSHVSENENTRNANAQQIIDILEHNIHEHVKHIERLLKKPLVQGALKQTLGNITKEYQKRSHLLPTTAVKDPTREERRFHSTMQRMLQSIYIKPHRTNRKQ